MMYFVVVFPVDFPVYPVVIHYFPIRFIYIKTVLPNPEIIRGVHCGYRYSLGDTSHYTALFVRFK